MKKNKDYLVWGATSFVSFLILAALAYWKISPTTYREFNTTCQHFNYEDCMRWFYNTRPYFQKVTISSLVLATLSLILTLVFYFRQNKKNDKLL
ncbi:MAG: hypothetical protein PHR98_01545 [Candidatus Shapirobacteria bacterium]|nr:hypothetical protein [Candidatus Shapirobacteria bacterium]